MSEKCPRCGAKRSFAGHLDGDWKYWRCESRESFGDHSFSQSYYCLERQLAQRDAELRSIEDFARDAANAGEDKGKAVYFRACLNTISRKAREAAKKGTK